MIPACDAFRPPLLAAAALSLLTVGDAATPASGGSTTLPPPINGHPGWLMYLSDIGLHRVDGDGNNTELLVRYTQSSIDQDQIGANCPPTGMAVDNFEKVVLWSCGTPTDSIKRHVYRCMYAENPPSIVEVDFPDAAKPGLRGGVAADTVNHVAYVAIHQGQGWRVQAFPLLGCDQRTTQVDCDKHRSEGCAWTTSCERVNQGAEVTQVRTLSYEGGGLTQAKGALELTIFDLPDHVGVVKRASDGSGSMTRLDQLTTLWEASLMSSVGGWHIGNIVATQELDPDHQLYVGAIADGKARIYKIDPDDNAAPEVVFDLPGAKWRSPGTPGVTTSLNEDGAHQPSFALLWEQKDVVYSTGKELIRMDQTKAGYSKTLLTASAAEGTLGPVVWHPHDGTAPPSAPPTSSPIVAPTKVPSTSPQVVPTAHPAVVPTLGPQGPQTEPPTSGTPPTASPAAGGSSTTGGNSTTSSSDGTTGSSTGNTTTSTTSGGTTGTTGSGSTTTGNSSAASSTGATPQTPPSDDSGSDVMIIVIIGLVLLLLCIGGFLYWYKVKSKVEPLPEEEKEDEVQLTGDAEQPKEVMPEAPLEQVTKEAAPLPLEDFSNLKDQYKALAMQHLKQLRHGEEIHDPMVDVEREKAQEELEMRRQAALDERQAAIDWAKAGILAGLQGNEVDRVMHQWRDAQDEPEHQHFNQQQALGVATVGAAAAGFASQRGRGAASAKRGPHLPPEQGTVFRQRSTSSNPPTPTRSSGNGRGRNGLHHTAGLSSPHPFRQISEKARYDSHPGTSSPPHRAARRVGTLRSLRQSPVFSQQSVKSKPLTEQ
eukprot:TRINITY_DN4235_c0_g1_i2.p1 TRINITY_DN4235_c0_g1~~TRINITY_DN4235_c0_g1_i2.p1  ORF type:complete len:820 (+),score=210.97 TRINITY_DN4235_c0_g1_i2:47-2506(+)